MNNLKLLLAGLTVLAGLAENVFGATNVVVNGQNFQSVIDASAPGDTLLVQPGVYPDASLNFNKPLTVYPTGTNGGMIQFMGNIQVTGTGAGANSFQSAYFLTNVLLTNAAVSFFDSIFKGPVSVSGGKLTLKRDLLYSPLTITNNAAFEALRATNYSAVTAVAATSANVPFLAVQCLFSNSPIGISGYKVWIGYNICANNVDQTTNLSVNNCDSVLVGNKFSNTGGYIYEIVTAGGTLKAYNNLVFADPYQSSPVQLNATSAELANNTIRINVINGNFGAFQVNGSSPVTLRASIIDGFPVTVSGGTVTPIVANGVAGSSIFISYCDLRSSGAGVALLTGVSTPLLNCLQQVDPLYVTNYDGTLNPGSPCLNAGPPDAIYNNRDGTRNTMGYTGGPFWNPANYTNNNPMVFYLNAPQTVAKGVQTTLPISAAATAGH